VENRRGGKVTGIAAHIQNACHAEWMRIDVAEPQSIRPVGQEKLLLVNHCLMQKGWRRLLLKEAD